jgi:hypothetical protein
MPFVALGHYPVAIEAAHVRWHSQQGPDEIANALALCALHHALFDLGVLGITEDRRIRVSRLYVARNEAGQAVDALAGKPLLIPRPRQPTVDVVLHLLTRPAGLQGSSQNIDPGPLMPMCGRSASTATGSVRASRKPFS